MTPEAKLKTAAQGDRATYERYLKRYQMGEPIPYILGRLEFRGRTFLCDRRAYITDPELSFLVDVLLEEIEDFQVKKGRMPNMVEFGFGGGPIGISLKMECPQLPLIGLDIDGGALNLGKTNARMFGVEIPLIESDFFESWPNDTADPDIIFGDPPWGSEDDLYDSERSSKYYDAMPLQSAYPKGGSALLHEQLIDVVKTRGWTSQLCLNIGVLPQKEVQVLRDRCRKSEILIHSPGERVLKCFP